MENILIKYKLKKTKPRIEVLNIFNNASHPLSADEIFQKSNKNVCKSLSTVYRILNQFHNLGIITKKLKKNSTDFYELSSDKHKHYIICIKCGKTNSIEKCSIAPLINYTKQFLNYKVIDHIIELNGICSKCQNLK